MLEHSLQKNPSDKYYGNDSSVSQKIKSSRKYSNFLTEAIQQMTEENITSITYKGDDSIRFDSGDLGLSIHGTHSTTITRAQNEEGDWDIDVKIHDYYDFKNEEHYEDLSAAMVEINNMAAEEQGKGINNYSIDIDIKDKKKKSD